MTHQIPLTTVKNCLRLVNKNFTSTANIHTGSHKLSKMKGSSSSVLTKAFPLKNLLQKSGRKRHILGKNPKPPIREPNVSEKNVKKEKKKDKKQKKGIIYTKEEFDTLRANFQEPGFEEPCQKLPEHIYKAFRSSWGVAHLEAIDNAVLASDYAENIKNSTPATSKMNSKANERSAKYPHFPVKVNISNEIDSNIIFIRNSNRECVKDDSYIKRPEKKRKFLEDFQILDFVDKSKAGEHYDKEQIMWEQIADRSMKLKKRADKRVTTKVPEVKCIFMPEPPLPQSDKAIVFSGSKPHFSTSANCRTLFTRKQEPEVNKIRSLVSKFQIIEPPILQLPMEPLTQKKHYVQEFQEQNEYLKMKNTVNDSIVTKDEWNKSSTNK